MPPVRAQSPTPPASPYALRALTWDEIEALPLADEATRGCPNCGGLHYTIVHPVSRTNPGYYRCKGTEWPNAEGHEFVEPCGSLFRGRPDVHYHAEWYASAAVCEFLRRFAPEVADV